MIIIAPIALTTEHIVETSVPPDPPPPVWSSTTAYERGAIVRTGTGSSEKRWRARFSTVPPVDPTSGLPYLSIIGINPTQANRIGRNNAGELLPNGTQYRHFDTPWWEDVTNDPYVENRYRMFSSDPSLGTASADTIEVVVKPPTRWSGVALFNVSADKVTIAIQNGPPYDAERSLAYTNPIHPNYPNATRCAFTDLPIVDPTEYPNATLRLKIEATDRGVYVGACIIGMATRIGHTLYGLSAELLDFSRFSRDTWGNITVIQRGYSDKLTYPHVIQASQIDQVRDILIDRRAKLTAFIGHDLFPLTMTYGYFVDFDLPYEVHSQTTASVVVESVLWEGEREPAPLRRAVHITPPTNNNCITSDLGPSRTLCLENGAITQRIAVTVLNPTILPTDTVTWEMTWVEGSSTLSFTSEILSTTCGQTLPVLRWPNATVPVAHQPGVALIRPKVLRDGEELAIEPAVLVISECGGGGGGGEPPVTTGWIDSHTLEIASPPDSVVHGYWHRLIPSSSELADIVLVGEAGFQQGFYVDLRGEGNSLVEVEFKEVQGRFNVKKYIDLPVEQHLVGTYTVTGNTIIPFGADDGDVGLLVVSASASFRARLSFSYAIPADSV